MFNVLDFFSGCGGMSFGLEQVGFNIIAGIDYDEAALNTFKFNHSKSMAILSDLSKANAINNIKSQINGSRKIDVLVGGPPCQGFSLTGPRNLDDPRNKLYNSMLIAAKEFNPKVILIENVRGMATLYKGAVLKDVVNSIEELGYSVTLPQVLDAANYGVPQHRLRLFTIATRNDINEFIFPRPTHGPSTSLPFVTCGEAISDLPSLENDLGLEAMEYQEMPKSKYQKLMRINSSVLWNHIGTKHTKYVKSVIAQVPEGGNHKDLPPGVGESRKFNEAWTRYHSERPSRTIDTGHRNHFHYKWDRVPTVRENARLQSFPDSFKFLGTKTQQNRQVGNAVPPLLAAALGEAIKSLLK